MTMKVGVGVACKTERIDKLRSGQQAHPRPHKLCKNCGTEFEIFKNSRTLFCSKKCRVELGEKERLKKVFEKMIAENTSVYELDDVLDLYREIRYGYFDNGEIGVVFEGEWIPDGDDDE